MDIGFLLPVLVIVATSLAPFITEWVKVGANNAFEGIPQAAKPLVHILVSAALAGLTGSILGGELPLSLGVGASTGLASAAGFFVGKRS